MKQKQNIFSIDKLSISDAHFPALFPFPRIGNSRNFLKFPAGSRGNHYQGKITYMDTYKPNFTKYVAFKNGLKNA